MRTAVTCSRMVSLIRPKNGENSQTNGIKLNQRARDAVDSTMPRSQLSNLHTSTFRLSLSIAITKSRPDTH
jgi:hypothetical protein